MDQLHDINQLIKELKSADFVTRNSAAGRIGMFDVAAAPYFMESLIHALSDPNDQVRCLAAFAIRRFCPTDDRALDLLINYAQNGEEDVRSAACNLLGELREVRAVNVLSYSVTKDPSSKVRGLAAEALGWVASTVQLPSLVSALSDPERDVRFEAAIAIQRLGLKAQDAVSALERCVDSEPDPDVKESMVAAMNSIGADPRVLIHLLGDPNEWIRFRASQGLAQVDASALSADTDTILEALGDSCAGVILNLLPVLGRFRNERGSIAPKIVEVMERFATSESVLKAGQSALEELDGTLQ